MRESSPSKPQTLVSPCGDIFISSIKATALSTAILLSSTCSTDRRAFPWRIVYQYQGLVDNQVLAELRLLKLWSLCHSFGMSDTKTRTSVNFVCRISVALRRSEKSTDDAGMKLTSVPRHKAFVAQNIMPELQKSLLSNRYTSRKPLKLNPWCVHVVSSNFPERWRSGSDTWEARFSESAELEVKNLLTRGYGLTVHLN